MCIKSVFGYQSISLYPTPNIREIRIEITSTAKQICDHSIRKIAAFFIKTQHSPNSIPSTALTDIEMAAAASQNVFPMPVITHFASEPSSAFTKDTLETARMIAFMLLQQLSSHQVNPVMAFGLRQGICSFPVNYLLRSC
jgi:hypothetical protein